jgi:hypothetical protein
MASRARVQDKQSGETFIADREQLPLAITSGRYTFVEWIDDRVADCVVVAAKAQSAVDTAPPLPRKTRRSKASDDFGIDVVLQPRQDAERVNTLAAFDKARADYVEMFKKEPPYGRGREWMADQVIAERRGTLPSAEALEVEWADVQERLPLEAAFWKQHGTGKPIGFEHIVELTQPVTMKARKHHDLTPAERRARDLLGDIRWTREDALRSLVPAMKQLAYRGAGRKPDFSHAADVEPDDRHALLQRHLPAIQRGDLTLSAIKGMLGLSSTSKVTALQRHFAFLRAMRSEPFPAILLTTRGQRGVVVRELTQEQADVWGALVRDLVTAVDVVLPGVVAEIEHGAVSADMIAQLPLPATPCRHAPILANLSLARAGHASARAAEAALEQIVDLVLGSTAP